MQQKELDDRKKKILSAVVHDYQRTAEPVGSRTITKTHLHDLSPATIRNEMADLEEEGYIVQPHTSAGRIPTDAGYRFYVDRLMKIVHPSLRDEEAVHTVYHQIHRQSVDEILHQTAKLLSHTLDYAAVVVNLGQHRRIYSSGASNLLHLPEFQDLIRAQKILTLLEEEQEIADIMEEYLDEDKEIAIRIGAENSHKTIKDCSVVVSSISIEGETIGGIGLLGPTRMFYSRASTLIDYVAKELSKVLSLKRSL